MTNNKTNFSRAFEHLQIGQWSMIYCFIWLSQQAKSTTSCHCTKQTNY